MCVGILSASMYICVLHVYLVLMEVKEGIGSPGTGYEWLWAINHVGDGKLNLGPLQEQQVFLITEPSLQPQPMSFYSDFYVEGM